MTKHEAEEDGQVMIMGSQNLCIYSAQFQIYFLFSFVP